MTRIVQGIVMSGRNFRDNDLFVSVYTREKGRLELLVRGAKKITSKLRAHVEPITLSQLMVANGRWANLLAGAQSLSAFPALKADYKKTVLALMLLEVADSLIDNEEPDEHIFILLRSWFDFLENNKLTESQAKQQLLAQLASWYLLYYLGYGPEVNKCVRCGGKILPQQHYFSISAGGLVCFDCLNKQTDEKISLPAVKILRFFFRQADPAAAFTNINKLRLPEQVAGEINSLAGNFVAYIMGRQPRVSQLLF